MAEILVEFIDYVIVFISKLNYYNILFMYYLICNCDPF